MAFKGALGLRREASLVLFVILDLYTLFERDYPQVSSDDILTGTYVANRQ